MSGPGRAFTERLAALFAVQTFGFAYAALNGGTAVGSIALVELGAGASASEVADRVIWLLVVASALGVLHPGSRRVAGLVGGAGMLVVAAAESLHGGKFGAAWTIGAHAVRWCAPFVLAGGAAGWPLPKQMVVLRWAAASVFFFHGLEALSGHPVFIDYLISVPCRTLGVCPTEAVAGRWLTVIGVVDVAVAVLMVTVRSTAVAGWMAGWGFLTATVRILDAGVAGWPAAVVRVTNGGVPLIIGGIWLADALSGRPRYRSPPPSP